MAVSAGDTVTWRNDQNVNNMVTSDTENEPDGAVLSQGQTCQHVFAEADLGHSFRPLPDILRGLTMLSKRNHVRS